MKFLSAILALVAVLVGLGTLHARLGADLWALLAIWAALMPPVRTWGQG